MDANSNGLFGLCFGSTVGSFARITLMFRVFVGSRFGPLSSRVSSHVSSQMLVFLRVSAGFSSHDSSHGWRRAEPRHLRANRAILRPFQIGRASCRERV